MYIITDKKRLVNIVEREILDYFERSENGRGTPSTTDKIFIIHHLLKPVGADSIYALFSSGAYRMLPYRY